jgi:anti-sigma B factor antagonist
LEENLMALSTPYPPPKVESSGDITVITLNGNEMRTVDNILAGLDEHTEGLGGSDLLLDFTNIRFLGSAELGTLVRLHKRLRASGVRLTLFDLSAQVYEVFTITRLHTLLGICREQAPKLIPAL